MKKLLMFIPVAAIILTSCGGGAKTDDAVQEMTGAGSTFDYPLFTKMFAEYNTKTGIKVNYQSIGSGGGIKQLISKTVDFGASDAFLNDAQEKDAGSPCINLPFCLGAVAMTYNLPGVTKLKLTGDIIGGIYCGTIKKWNDPKIMAENAGTTLPDKDILVVHRSDGSGTTNIYTDYLIKASPEFAVKVPKRGTTVDWPAGVGAKGNEGVAGQIKQSEGAIGYVELAYAMQNKMSVADIKNPSGSYITPNLASTTAAANVEIPADGKIMITNSPDAQAYPIVGFSWVIVYKEQKYGDRTEAKGKAVADLLWWMIHDGQQFNEGLTYGKLSDKAVKVDEENLKTMTFDGKPLMAANPK